MRSARKTAKTLAVLVAAATIPLATACGAPSINAPGAGATTAGAPASVSTADVDKAMNTPTTLTFWTWVPNIQNEVDLFEAKYPQIKVNVVDTTGGTQQYPKLRAAIKAGKGAPDVVQIEYQYIPSFRQTKSLANLAPYGAAADQSKYIDWIWNQVADGTGVWSVPQDAGPLGNLYRNDIFAKAGITTPPATWDEFAKDAALVKSKTGSYIADLPGNDPGQMIGLFWQAGANPFGYDGNKTVSVKIDSPETQKVVALWQDLIQKDQVSVDPDFNNDWYQGLSRGKYASWQVAAWGPIFLQGTAKNTSGKWTAAEIPQWTEGADVSGNWGGSTDAVLDSSQNKIAAYEFSKFINSDPSSALKLANEQFLFPTTTATLQSPDFTGQKSEFYGGQKVNEFFAGVSGTVDKQFQWLPFTDYVYSSYNSTLGTAIANKGDMKAALTEWQNQVVTYAKQQGFTVTP